MKYQEMRIRVTKAALEEFKDSILWKDIKRELGMWKRMAGAELVSLAHDAKSLEDLTHIARIGGRVEAINYMLGIPDIFLQEIDNVRRNKTD